MQNYAKNAQLLGCHFRLGTFTRHSCLLFHHPELSRFNISGVAPNK